MYEVELKADITHIVDGTLRRIGDAGGRHLGRVTYHDLYFDTPDNRLSSNERELRLREVRGDFCDVRLTFKGAIVDARSCSKEEFESSVASFSQIKEILLALGYVPACELEKQCRLYAVDYRGVTVDLAVVSVTGVDRTFLEVELPTTEQGDVPSSLAILSSLLQELSVPDCRLTSEYYTDMVR